MHRPIATAALIGFAAILALASLTAHARLVKWTLDDVNFLIYPLSDNAGAILPHPVPDTIYPYLQPATGWFTVDTESHQITDWGIAAGYGGDFVPHLCGDYQRDIPCAAWLDRAVLGSGENSIDGRIVSHVLGGQSFEFLTVPLPVSQCGNCTEPPSLTLVGLSFLSKEETGGTIKLVSGTFSDIPCPGCRVEDYSGFLVSGSLIGTVVPEPGTMWYLGIAALMLGASALWRRKPLVIKDFVSCR